MTIKLEAFTMKKRKGGDFMEKMYKSTRGKQKRIDVYDALLQGIASDGGLLVPDFAIEKLDLKALSSLSYPDLASTIIKQFVDERGYVGVEKACQEAYQEANLFSTKEVVKVVKAGEVYVGELFNGPTAAFKDMALTLLPRLMSLALQIKEEKRTVLVLAATSGDTGKAALEGFKDVEGTKIKVFYPSVGVSAIQKQQMVTQTGSNVEVVAIDGNFDDAQSAVKKAFNDDVLKQCCKDHSVFLSSANSINVGRLLPQIVYYFYSYFSLVKQNEIKLGDEVDFCVPSGNFGNALAGFLAKQMGCPIHKILCSSNSNHILTDFFNTGVYDANREFYKTSAPAMDILVSSNLERLVYYLSNQDEKFVAEAMQKLNTTKKYEVSKEIFSKMQEEFVAGYANEQQIQQAIKEMYETNHYLLDTHTATGYHFIKEYRKTQKEIYPTILLATASPYKFPESVYHALTNQQIPEYDALKALKEMTLVDLPKPLIGLENKEVLFKQTIPKEAILDFVKERIAGGDVK